MNSNKFQRSLFTALNTYDVNLKFVEEWHKETINTLKIIKEQSLKIKNPRHLGDFLENQIKGILSKYLPKRYSIEKGYGLNSFSGMSGEQDLLIVDNSLGAAICATDSIGYFPIECIIASIEVKSNLSYRELQKCIVSCINLKKLNNNPFDYKDDPSQRIFYAIFAYTSEHDDNLFLKNLNAEMDQIPENLRPNCILVINRGVYLPSVSGYILFSLEHIQKCAEEYKFIKSTEKQESQNFVLFLSLLIEHAFHQSPLRQPTKLSNYVIHPSIWQETIEKNRGTYSPVRKLVNSHVMWPEDWENPGIPNIEVTCSKCGSKHIFAPIPPSSKKLEENFRKSFSSEGIIPIKRSEEIHKCACENSIKIPWKT